MQDDILRRRDLTLSAKVVHAVIVDSMRGNESVKIGVRTIMGRTALSEWPIVAAIKGLERAGLLVVERGKRGQATTYRLPKALRYMQRSANQITGSTVVERATATVAERATEALQPVQRNTDQTRHTHLLSTEDAPPKRRVPKLERPKKTRARTPRDDLWDVIVEIWLKSGVPESQRSRVGRLCREFKAYGATPDDIRVRYKRAVEAWRQPERVTPEALVKHWGQFPADSPDGGAAGRPRSAAAERRAARAAREYPEDRILS